MYASTAQLLATLLGYNPYNSNLDLKVNQEMSKQAEAELRAMAPAPPASPAQNGEESGDGGADQAGSATDEASGEGPAALVCSTTRPGFARIHRRVRCVFGRDGTAVRWRGSQLLCPSIVDEDAVSVSVSVSIAFIRPLRRF